VIAKDLLLEKSMRKNISPAYRAKIHRASVLKLDFYYTLKKTIEINVITENFSVFLEKLSVLILEIQKAFIIDLNDILDFEFETFELNDKKFVTIIHYLTETEKTLERNIANHETMVADQAVKEEIKEYEIYLKLKEKWEGKVPEKNNTLTTYLE
jgi:hypothetical protein